MASLDPNDFFDWERVGRDVAFVASVVLLVSLSVAICLAMKI